MLRLKNQFLKRRTALALMLILIVFSTILLTSQRRISWTVDEFRWIRAGESIETNGWTEHPDEISHPILFMASHSLMRRLFSDGTPNSDVFFSRLGLLPYQLAGMIILFFWTLTCHRIWGAVIASGFLAFSPTYLAHARLANSDAMLAVAVLAAIVSLSMFLKKPNLLTSLLLGTAYSFGMLTKFSFLLIPLLFPFIILLTPGSLSLRLQKVLKGWILPFAVALLIVNIVYGFQGTGRRLDALHFESPTMQNLAAGPAGILPVPLPTRYLLGMDVHLGFQNRWPGFMLGTISDARFIGYDVFALLVKTTLPALLLIFLGLIGIVKKRPTIDEILALTISLFWLTFFSFFCKIDCGIRFILPVYPLLFFFGSRITDYHWCCRISGVAIAFILLVLHASASLNAHPFYLSYFNCLAGGHRNGYRLLGDSNLSWCQDLKELRNYQEQKKIDCLIFGLEQRHPILDPYITYRPITHREKYFPMSGDYAVWIATLQMLIQKDPSAFLWFRLIKPSTVIADTAYIYHLDIQPGKELDYLRQSLETCRKSGFLYPWAEEWLNTVGDKLFFPLRLAQSDSTDGFFEFVTDNAPPAHLLAVSSLSSNTEITIVDVSGLPYPIRRLSVAGDARSWFSWDKDIRIGKVIVNRTNSENQIPDVFLVYDLLTESESIPGFRIQCISETITQKIQSENNNHDRQSRKNGHMGSFPEVVNSRIEYTTP